MQHSSSCLFLTVLILFKEGKGISLHSSMKRPHFCPMQPQNGFNFSLQAFPIGLKHLFYVLFRFLADC